MRLHSVWMHGGCAMARRHTKPIVEYINDVNRFPFFFLSSSHGFHILYIHPFTSLHSNPPTYIPTPPSANFRAFTSTPCSSTSSSPPPCSPSRPHCPTRLPRAIQAHARKATAALRTRCAGPDICASDTRLWILRLGRGVLALIRRCVVEYCERTIKNKTSW